MMQMYPFCSADTVVFCEASLIAVAHLPLFRVLEVDCKHTDWLTDIHPSIMMEQLSELKLVRLKLHFPFFPNFVNFRDFTFAEM